MGKKVDKVCKLHNHYGVFTFVFQVHIGIAKKTTTSQPSHKQLNFSTLFHITTFFLIAKTKSCSVLDEYQQNSEYIQLQCGAN